jgi:hypothetical protein
MWFNFLKPGVNVLKNPRNFQVFAATLFMKSFRTDVSITPFTQPIGLKNKVFTVGSCFSEAMGTRLNRFKFSVLPNPFGTIYNPMAIHRAVQYAIYNESPPEHTYLQNREIYLNYDFHSEQSALAKSELKDRINNIIGSSHYFLKDANWLLITYGTAWVYSRKDTGEIVANCHKMPGDAFTKSLLSEKDIVDSFGTLHSMLMKLNPALKIILTLSPVRHIKDTLELNSVSKAVIRVACHAIIQKFRDVAYFPAYEIMMDDLRDYRFYKSDMLHPSEEAEDYIWEKFSDRYFSADTKMFINRWKSILAALSHKPFHPTSAAHQQFLLETLKKLEELKTLVNVEDEIATIKSQLLT